MGSRYLGDQKLGMNTLRTIVVAAIAVFSSLVVAEPLTIPHTFNPGDPTNSSQMNENFNAVKTAVNENSRRIDEISSNPSNRSFIGFSNDEITGNAGVGGMILTCNATFPESKVCTSGEIVNGTSYPDSFDSLDQMGWVLPELIPFGDNNKRYYDKWSGLGTLSESFCHTEQGTQSGIVLSWTGSFFTRPCEQSYRVACCQ